MPIIRRETIYYKQGQFRKITRYSGKHFCIKLPDWVEAVINQSEVYGDTENDVDFAYRKAVEECNKRQETKRKVLLYKVDISAKIYKRDSDGEIEECILSREDISFCKTDCALGIGYHVFWETTLNGDKTYTKLDGSSLGHFSEDGWTVVDWTPEVEAFFENTVAALETLILKVDKFFEDDKKLLAHIKSGLKLLPKG